MIAREPGENSAVCVVVPVPHRAFILLQRFMEMENVK